MKKNKIRGTVVSFIFQQGLSENTSWTILLLRENYDKDFLNIKAQLQV